MDFKASGYNGLTLQDWQEEIPEREGFNKPPTRGFFILDTIPTYRFINKLS